MECRKLFCVPALETGLNKKKQNKTPPTLCFTYYKRNDVCGIKNEKKLKYC